MAKTPAKAATVPTTNEELLAAFKDFPAINVLSRRLLNPSNPGSLPILLTDEPDQPCKNSDHQRLIKANTVKCPKCRLPVRKWAVRWCNQNIEGRWAEMKTLGYVPVLIKELQDKEEVSDLVKQTEDNGDTYVRRGDRGKEVLMKQPLAIFNQIKALQHEARNAAFKSKKTLQAELAESAGKRLGDEAGQYIHDGGIQVEQLNQGREAVNLGDLTDA